MRWEWTLGTAEIVLRLRKSLPLTLMAILPLLGYRRNDDNREFLGAVKLIKRHLTAFYV